MKKIILAIAVAVVMFVLLSFLGALREDAYTECRKSHTALECDLFRE
jgi:hypothetical protein